MADKNLVQHIDKISYAVAGVVGLVLLILPIISGGDVNKTRDDLNREASELQRKKQEQALPPLPRLELKDEIEAQWRPGSGGESPKWITGAAPALVKRVKSIKKMAATHSPGVVAEISAHRDPQRKQVYLVVKGAMGADNEYVKIDRVELFRREGSGKFESVKTFTGDFEYRDDKVKAGETYAYKFTTVASRDASAPGNILPPEATEQESAELETPPIPYDFSVKVRQTFEAQQIGDVPAMMADFNYFDYAQGDVVKQERGRFKEKDVVGKRYQISRIDPDKRAVTVKDGLRRTRHTIASKDEPFAVELWEPVTGSAEEQPAGGDETATETAEPETEPEPEPEAEAEAEAEETSEPDPAPTPTRGSGRRGGRSF